jgi:hypothetical protein
MPLPRIAAACAALACALSAAFAQEPSFDDAASAETVRYAEVHAALGRWRGGRGEAWAIEYDRETAAARLLHGPAVEAAFEPRRDEDFLALARASVDATRAMHRVDPGTLGAGEVVFLPLANAGTTDKVSVEMRQAWRGVPVIGGSVHALFDARGRLLAVDSTALPDLELLSTTPAISGARAAEIAVAAFRASARVEPTSISAAELAIDQVERGKRRAPLLVWRVDVQAIEPGFAPEGVEYRVDASSGRIESARPSIHHDVSGSVATLASPGVLPDTPSNPETQQPAANAEVSSAFGDVATDANGNFTIPGASPPLAVTVRYRGPFAKVRNSAGSEHTVAATLTAASGSQLLLNPSPTEATTAEANAFVWINALREWIRAVNPADSHADFQAVANVNIASACNAYYSGPSVNFFASGGGCVNTAYSTVVAHEMGHWLNDRYGSGNGGDGFGEGNADTWAMYLADDPEIGENFCGNGCTIRSGNNTRPYCGNGNPGCYGEVHADGEVLMGALWKVRANLKASLGASAGSAAADTLFNAWMNAYNDGQIKPVVETHWLVLDDDDGSIANGTPHHAEIDGGFRAQGFPGHTIANVYFAQVTQVADTPNEFDPFPVTANLTPGANPPVASATVWYRVDGGPFAAVPMTAPASGNTWSGEIPRQSCPAFVEYYLSAADSAGNVDVFPAGAPAELRSFHVEQRSILFASDFEGGLGGWTHGSSAGVDDWQTSAQLGIAASYGEAGDPTTAASGTGIAGNDLGGPGADGYYAPSSSSYLRSPPIDCSSATGTRLRLKRWLRVERGSDDRAEIAVEGAVVWSNPQSSDLLDDAWVELDLDISAWADLNPSVEVEFRLQSDSSLEFGGWNVDQVEVYVHGSCDDFCPQPLAYCTAKLTGSGLTPAIGSTGSATLAQNDFRITLSTAPPYRQAICIHGADAAAEPFYGGYLCVHAPFVRMPVIQTDASGSASVAFPVDASMLGTERRFQWWFRDPEEYFFRVGLSDGLLVRICN